MIHRESKVQAVISHHYTYTVIKNQEDHMRTQTIFIKK